MNKSVRSIIALYLISASCMNTSNLPVYEVKYLNEVYLIDDSIPGDDIWDKSITIRDFTLPWDDKVPPVTEFRALYDSNCFHFLYLAEDINLVIKDTFRSEIDVTSEDRVELFISKNKSMDEYFCLEIDPLGRILDYKASYYREFDEKWNVEGIKIISNFIPTSYTIEVSIPLESIESMGIDISKDFYMGLFRADYEKTDSGLKENWLSWVKPKIEKPDFHVPEALGIFRFMK